MQTIRARLGKRVRYLRTKLGWSQEKLGEKASLHPTYVGGIERGERNVSLDNLTKLSEAFQITLSELFRFLQDGSAGDRALRKKVKELLSEQDQAVKKLISELQDNLPVLLDHVEEFSKLISELKGES